MNEKENKAVELSDEDMETLNEEAKKKELSMEELEQVTGGLKESGPGLLKPSTTL